MRAWVSRKFHESPWLTAAVVVYLALSAAEVTRVILIAEPLDENDVGFSPWQEVPAPDGSQAKLLFRWSEPSSAMYRPVEAPVLGLTVYRPEGAEGEVDVAFALDGEPLDAYTAGIAGTYSFYYYLPPMLEASKWAEAQARWTEREREEARRAEGGWFANWQELKPWSLPPSPPAIEIRPTLDPVSGVGASGDGDASPPEATETHAVGLATVEWLDALPSGGAGFHEPETDADGTPVRWTRRWASQPLVIEGAEAVLALRAIHPGIVADPVTVRVFWNDELRATIELSDAEWARVPVDLAVPASVGVLTLNVDRTWSPARIGVSEDRRELGVMFAGVTWR